MAKKAPIRTGEHVIVVEDSDWVQVFALANRVYTDNTMDVTIEPYAPERRNLAGVTIAANETAARTLDTLPVGWSGLDPE